MGLSSPIALNAAFLYEVTMFHPNRPCVIWSSVENRLASRNGASEEVDEVMAKVRCFVTAAMAEMGCAVNVSSVLCFRAGQRHTIDGSVTGHCAARRMHSSSFPWYVSCPPKVSARNRALIPPRSRSFASSIQYSRLRLVADLSLGFCAQLGQSGFQEEEEEEEGISSILTFHWPGDKCPTVLISNAFSRMCFWPVRPVEAVPALSPILSVDLERSCQLLSSLIQLGEE